MRGISYPMLFYGSLIKKYSTFSPVYTMKHESYMIITIIDILQDTRKVRMVFIRLQCVQLFLRVSQCLHCCSLFKTPSFSAAYRWASLHNKHTLSTELQVQCISL